MPFKNTLPGRLSWSAWLLPLSLLSCSADETDGTVSAQGKTPPAPAVVVATIAKKTVPVRREFVARTEPVEQIDVQARVEAILDKREFEEGTRVEKGEILYRLDPRTYQAELSSAQAQLSQAKAELKLAEEQVSVRAAEAALASAQAKLKKARQDVARLRPLAEKDAVPRQDLDTALAEEEVAQAGVNAQEATLKNAKIQEEVGILMARARVKASGASVDLAQLNLDYCTITAPIDGLIGRTRINTGNLVGRGESSVLATLSSIDPMYLTFAISETEYLLATKEGDKRNKPKMAVHLILSDDSEYPHDGKITTADRAVSEETGTLQLVAEFPNPDGFLRPGQFGRASLIVAKIEDAVLVPQRAVIDQQGAKIVFVVDGNNMVSLRTLHLGERFEDFYVVHEGLHAGETVILEGQLKARPGSPVKPTTKGVSAEPSQGR